MSIILDGSNANTVGIPNLGTAQASTSGTAITFTGIPSGVKRIIVMFNGVSTSGTSTPQIQVGSGSTATTGYVGSGARIQGSSCTSISPSTSSFLIASINTQTDTQNGSAIFCTLGNNIWTMQCNLWSSGYNAMHMSAGAVTLSGVLDRVVISAQNGTDTFDAGSINIQYE